MLKNNGNKFQETKKNLIEDFYYEILYIIVNIILMGFLLVHYFLLLKFRNNLQKKSFGLSQTISINNPSISRFSMNSGFIKSNFNNEPLLEKGKK